jgi:hypothetical protein
VTNDSFEIKNPEHWMERSGRGLPLPVPGRTGEDHRALQFGQSRLEAISHFVVALFLLPFGPFLDVAAREGFEHGTLNSCVPCSCYFSPTCSITSVTFIRVSYSKSAVQCSTVQYSTVQYSAVLYCTVLYCIVQSVQYSTVQYSTVQSVQYSTVSTQTTAYDSCVCVCAYI